jgi:CHAT domain-containing protein
MALSDFVANSPAEADLRSPGLFLELGTDEALVNYPWELLHDGDDFLCLKHYLGRYVNTTRISAPRMQPQNSPSEYDKIRILLISVPAAPGASYLPGAQAETVSLVQALSPLPQVELTLMKAPEATVMNVRSEIRSGQYQIVHFCGHAAFNSVDPRRSALMLCDNPLEAGIILLHLKSVVLSFVNACQTAQQAPQPPAWETEFNTFSLARAFMEAESYLLGSRWKLSDKAAPVFATSFYKALLEEWKPIGEAVVAARKACRQASMPDDVGWASYVYYGDPRLGFEPVS